MHHDDPTLATYNDPKIVEAYMQEKSADFQRSFHLNIFTKKLKPGASILDIGCGPGLSTIEFAKRGFHVTAIDYAQGMIDMAMQQAAKEQDLPIQPVFQVLNMYDIAKTFLPEYFDAVWASASLLHIPHNQIHTVLQDISTILKPGGIAFISMKRGEIEEKVIHEELDGNTLERFFAFWEHDAFVEAGQKAGFTLLESDEKDPTYPEGRKPRSRWLNVIFQKPL